ncbi:DNA polymerase III epsilon subunit [Pseudomonas synxantha]|nr:DNA polymerase III epsilon subunit [Pseudomonas synxantha]
MLVGCQAAIGGKPPPTLGPRPSVKYWSAVRPPSGASPLPHLGRDHQSNTGRLSGRHRGQAPSHTWAETISQILVGCQAAIGGKPPPTLGPRPSVKYWSAVRPPSGASPLPHLGRDHQSNTGRLSGRHRGQAPPTLGPRPSVKYWSAVRPPSGASPLPHLGRDHQSNTGRLSGRHRGQAPPTLGPRPSVKYWSAVRPPSGGKPPPTLGPRPSVKYWSAVRPPSGASPLPHLDRDHQSNTGRLSGRHRGQAPSHTWAETISQILVGCQAAIGGKSNRRTAPPTFGSRCIS